MGYKNKDKMIRVWIGNAQHKKAKKASILLNKTSLEVLNQAIDKGVDKLLSEDLT